MSLGTQLFIPSGWTGHQPGPQTLLPDSFRENMIPLTLSGKWSPCTEPEATTMCQPRGPSPSHEAAQIVPL